MYELLAQRGADWMKLTGNYDELKLMQRVFARHDIKSKIYAVGFDGLYYIIVEEDACE